MQWTGMVEIRPKDFINIVPVIPYRNLLWIMGSRIYRKGKTQIPLSPPITIDAQAQDPG